MNEAPAPIHLVSRIMLVTAAIFLVLAGVTSLYGTDYGLDRETADILSLVFLFVAGADFVTSVFLRRRSA